MDTGIARAYALSQAVLAMVRERRGQDLEAWMAEATDSGIAALARVARGLQGDLSAITSGLTLAWSNGVTEGQMHRRKLVQRQGYGRAGVALLRQHVLQAAEACVWRTPGHASPALTPARRAADASTARLWSQTMRQHLWARAALVYNGLTRLVPLGSIDSWGDTGMKPMAIVIPSDNTRHWYLQNLGSVCAQAYDNVRAIYVDDGSSDQTGALVAQLLADHAVGHRIQLIRNPVRVGALENLYRMIHACADQEIVILLDGDDWLAHPRVLQQLNAVYADPHCWMTYGQYGSWPAPVLGYSRPIPAQMTDTNTFRGYDWCASHLRSFYAWLFKRIHPEAFISPWGTFYPMAWDQALMFPMLEMAGHRAQFIPDVLYTYNTANPLSDAKVNRPLQQRCETAIRLQKRYDRL